MADVKNSRKAILFALVGVIGLIGLASAQELSEPRFKGIAFDYFVLFDANSVVPEVEKAYPGKGAEFTKM
jgi:2-haloacid dehalogenase